MQNDMGIRGASRLIARPDTREEVRTSFHGERLTRPAVILFSSIKQSGQRFRILYIYRDTVTMS